MSTLDVEEVGGEEIGSGECRGDKIGLRG